MNIISVIGLILLIYGVDMLIEIKGDVKRIAHEVNYINYMKDEAKNG